MRDQHKKIAIWARKKFKNWSIPNQGTVSRIIRSSTYIKNLSLCCVIISRKNLQRHQNMRPSFMLGSRTKTPSVKPYQDQFRRHMQRGYRLSETSSDISTIKSINFVWWLAKFQARLGLKFRINYGKPGSADKEVINASFPAIYEVMSQYAAKDIWNADEFGILYWQSWSWTLCTNPAKTIKKKSAYDFYIILQFYHGGGVPVQNDWKTKRLRVFWRTSRKKFRFDY